MTDPAPIQNPPPGKTLRLEPTFFGALRGVWLFTWRTQVAWRKFSLALLGLFALPLLIYLTTASPEAWIRNHQLSMGEPSAYLNNFSRRLVRARLPLQKEQRDALLKIITEEFGKAESEAAKLTAETSQERQDEQREDCYNLIRQRAKDILDDRQVAQLQNAQRRFRDDRPAIIQELAWNRTAPFYHWLIDVYFFMLLPLNCVRMCGAVIRDELEAATLTFLTTRPISRAKLLLAKFLAQTAWLQLWMLVQAVLLFAVAGLRQIPSLGTLLPMFLAIQVLAVFGWCALGLVLGQITKRYMGLALFYGAIIEMSIGRIPTNINNLSLMRHLKALLGHNEALQGIYNWPVLGIWGPSGALAIAVVIFLTCACLLFTFREYHHTTEMQK